MKKKVNYIQTTVDNVKLRLRIDADHTESIHARHVYDDIYQVLSIPFMCQDIHYGDHICYFEDGEYLVVKFHGNHTLRIAFKREATDAQVNTMIAAIDKLKLRGESGFPVFRMVCYNVPIKFDLLPVYDCIGRLAEGLNISVYEVS